MKTINFIRKHSKGPWKWSVNEGGKNVNLEGGVPVFDKNVMSFSRWGMHHATPMFNAKIAGDEYNEMMKATHFSEPEENRKHHSHWHKIINHPDAKLIEAAPDMLDCLIERAKLLMDFVHADIVVGSELHRLLDLIKKAGIEVVYE